MIIKIQFSDQNDSRDTEPVADCTNEIYLNARVNIPEESRRGADWGTALEP